MAHKGNDKCGGKDSLVMRGELGGYVQGEPGGLVFNARVQGPLGKGRTDLEKPPAVGRRETSHIFRSIISSAVINHVDDKRFANFKTV